MSMNARTDRSFKTFYPKLLSNSLFLGEFERSGNENYFLLFAIPRCLPDADSVTLALFFLTNNPVKYTDPDGRVVFAIPIAVAVVDFIISYGIPAAIGAAATVAAAHDVYNTVKNSRPTATQSETADNTNAENAADNVKSKAQATPNAPQQPKEPEKPDNDKKQTSANQMQSKINRGQAPDSFERADKANTNVKGEQDHIHLKDGNALNKDGTWKEGGGRKLTNSEKRFLKENNWELPKE